MSRHVERYITFAAQIVGHNAIPNQPLEVMVTRIPAKGQKADLIHSPFSAFTSRAVEKICGTSGIMLKGGIVIPWERFEKHDVPVLVREDLRRNAGLPTVLVNSLINGSQSVLK